MQLLGPDLAVARCGPPQKAAAAARDRPLVCKMGTEKEDKMDLGADATSVGLKASSADAEKTSVSYAVQVGEQQALAKSGQLEGALQNLLALEKPARLVRAS
jgi:hypothetical protein